MQPPFKKRGFVRSLSTIIRGLKDQEVEKADEDWDLLHEMETEPTEAISNPLRASNSQVVLETQFESQDVDDKEMPLGPDTLSGSDDDDSAAETGALGPDGKPRKVWKKKGLKRQTRKVTMKPPTRQPVIDEEPIDMEAVLKVFEAVPKDDVTSDDDDPSSRPDSGVPRTKSSLKRKISATAHANFCRLKIKSKNSKAKGRGRFGRR